MPAKQITVIMFFINRKLRIRLQLQSHTAFFLEEPLGIGLQLQLQAFFPRKDLLELDYSQCLVTLPRHSFVP